MRPLLWAPMLVLRAVVAALGLVMVPLMLAFTNRPAWLFRPWYDPTGVAQWWPAYVEREGNAFVKRFPMFWWFAIRNPANGLRTYSGLACDVFQSQLKWRDNDLPTNPKPLRATGKRLGWFYAWHGVYSGFWACVLWNKTHHAKFRIGWKLVPDEEQFRHEWKPDRAGFAASVLPWRKG